MPNIKSAKKRVKVIATKTLRNKAINTALKTDIKKANLGFMAVTLKQGKHDIEFYYTTPGLKIGVFLTLGGWLFIMGFIIKRSKIREK